MLQKEIFLVLGLAGILAINYFLPERFFINTDLVPEYEIALVPKANPNETNPKVLSGNSQISNRQDESNNLFLTTASMNPSQGVPGQSFGVTISSGGIGWASGYHCVSISDDVTMFTMLGFVATTNFTTMSGTLSIPSDANVSSNYDILVYDTNSQGCSGTSSSNCVDCFTVLLDSDMDGVADINDNCPNDPNPDQTNIDGDDYGAACDCNDNNPNDEHLMVNDDPIASGFHYGIISVNSAGHVASMLTPVDFLAGQFIDLNAGFQVDLGHVFTAQIGDCP